ncbi:S-layer homology domain-containing protein [Sporosarcina sp. G11-34]|uniref:S-layer homology domain-containing protein n=1 Tax=Sporosarcina sp. G11-34 TaxID=2849605 RepID=UPI0022A90971|nr:S-layer homology domain-containing protein [Sporosarcina sp. G11-34]MCZ2257580.1 S-layer homology domain-containing protein [Sporosarcina sp. G11-34]
MVLKTNNYKKFVATAATATLVATAIVPGASAGVTTASFTDVPASYKEAVNFVVSNNFALGEKPTSFGIDNNIKRGDFASILAKAAGLMDDKAPASGFSDVVARDAIAVNSLKAAGVINGVSATKFGSADPIKRGDAAIMLQKALELDTGDAKADFSDVKDRYKDAVAALVNLKVTNGQTATQFGTDSNIKRGDFAKWLYALKDFVVLGDPAPAPVPVPGELGIGFSKAYLIADGNDNLLVTFEILGKDGKVDTSINGISLELRSSHGTFDFSKVTVQNGVAQATLTSQASSKDLDVKVEAIVDATTIPTDVQIGTKHVSKNIAFKTDAGLTPKVNLVAAESNQADRVFAKFDQNVELSDFVKTNSDGQLLYDVYATDGQTLLEDAVVKAKTLKYDAEQVRHSLRDVKNETGTTKSLVVKQNGQKFAVQGIKAIEGNSKAFDIILVKAANSDGVVDVLDNNKTIVVESNYTARKGQFNGHVTNSTVKFILTDATAPSAVKVYNESLKDLVVEFSESVLDGSAAFKLDGIYGVGTGIKDPVYGEFDVRTLVDERHLVFLELTKDYKEIKGNPGYFSAGQHKVEVSAYKDFAGNLGATKNLTFNVAANTVRPTAEVKVLSPEQWHITFNAPLVQPNVILTNDNLVVEVYNEKLKKFEESKVKLGVNAVIERVGKTNEYVLELTQDWTHIYDTANNPNANYYNDEYRVVLKGYNELEAAGNTNAAIKNSDNGLALVNDFVLELNDPIMKSADTTSPKIKKITQADLKDLFIVTMDEPVKLKGDVDNAGDTPSQEQNWNVPLTTVQFIGKDAAGKTVTINGTYTKYVDHTDTSFYVKSDQNLQNLVNNKGYSEDWKVVVKAISDDIGNTAATETENFKILKQVTVAPFFIEEAHYDSNSIVVTFSDGVLHKGETFDATRVTNYALNGKALPEGTSISVEDKDSVAGYETVIITFPAGTLDVKSNNVLNVQRELKSYDGAKLEGEHEIEIPYNVDGNTSNAS